MTLQQIADLETATEHPALGRPLRVALVVHTFEIGGIERHVARLASRLDRRRFQPLIICLERSGQAAQWIETGDVPVIELHKRPRNDLRLVFRLARVLRDERIDVVHSHNWGTLVETSVARRLAGTPVHVHAERGTVLGELEPRGLRSRLRALAMRWAVGRASAVVSNAEAVARRAAAAARLPLERITVIPNGLDEPEAFGPDAAKEMRRRLAIPEDAVVIGSVGRLAAVKNFASAIEAVSRLPESMKQIHLLLVGDGPERAKLEELASQRHVADRIHFAGRHDDVLPLLAAMDVYLNCSLSEGMSQSLVEAMSLGLPLVATDVGDNAVLVGGTDGCGFVVERDDVAGLTAALERVAGSAELRSALGHNSRRRFAERYRIDRMLSRYESLYEILCSPSLRSPSRQS